MKRNTLQRVMALLLLVCMVVSLLPVSVFAQEGESDKPTTKAATNYFSQIDSLATPYNEAFNPPNHSYMANFADHGYYYMFKRLTIRADTCCLCRRDPSISICLQAM